MSMASRFPAAVNTVQRVKRQEFHDGGSTLTLACGHQAWCGGVRHRVESFGCLQSPCYRTGRYMGE